MNGHHTYYVRNSRHEAQRASKVLTAAAGFPVTATALIVVSGASGGLTVKEQPVGEDVVVVTRREVTKWLTHRAQTLTTDHVNGIYEQARRSTTWQAERAAPRARR